MNRSKIEETKAIVMTAFALISFALVMWDHDYKMVWIPVVLGIFSIWLWWKVDFYTRRGE